MNVKNRIATFEAHNEEIRRAPDSPLSQVSGRSPAASSMGRLALTPTDSRGTTPVSSVARNSPDRPPSTTSVASANRISRLRDLAGTKQGLRAPQPPDSPGGGSIAAMHRNAQARRLMGVADDRSDTEAPGGSSKPGSSLFSHRKEQRNGISNWNDPADNHAISPNLSDGSQPQSSSGLPQNASHIRMIRRQKMSQRDAPEGRDDSAHAQSNGHQQLTSARLAKIQRIKKIKGMEHNRRNQQLSRASKESISPDPYSTRQHAQSSPARGVNAIPSLEPTDDEEITLTSVRQIVTGKESPLMPEGVSNLADDSMMTKDSDFDSAPRLWMQDGEEKSNKETKRGIVMTRSSSSDYDTDAESRGRSSTLYGEQVLQDPTLSAMSNSQMTPDAAVFFEQRRRQKRNAKKIPTRDDDEITYDYGDRDDDDDDSQVSLSYQQRREKEQKEREAREAAVAAAKAEMGGPFVQKEDVDYYRESLNSPIVKTAAGVIGAATLGCIIMGPMGLLVGAAAVGIGVGAMQIPEEQRSNMGNKAKKALKTAQESALDASEQLSSSCANQYRESGIAEHMPAEINSCSICTGTDIEANGGGQHAEDIVDAAASEVKDNVRGAEGATSKGKEGITMPSPVRSNSRQLRDKKDKIACMREGRIIPVNEIYALDPTAQPRAWLDVLANAGTTHEEKMEAMEEVIILSKDKQRARVFLDEGILDSVMWTLGRYFEKKNPSEEWAHPEISQQEADAAKLAANCCLTLGKAHCAAIHTEGDLLLMSLYERGTVPEERQLAQMLHEVPYHARVTKTTDPTVIDPGSEAFALKQMTLSQAEELARTIMAVAEGRF